jgi:hypothetical protein
MATSESNPPPQPQRYDPFSYPHLYPSGWTLDDGNAEQGSPADEASAAEPEPNPNAMPSWYEPFRDLRTFPSGWDLP